MSGVRLARAAAAAMAAGTTTILLAPAALWACPACATRDAAGVSTLALVGAMIAVPYAVAAVALRVIRHLDKDPG